MIREVNKVREEKRKEKRREERKEKKRKEKREEKRRDETRRDKKKWIVMNRNETRLGETKHSFKVFRRTIVLHKHSSDFRRIARISNICIYLPHQQL